MAKNKSDGATSSSDVAAAPVLSADALSKLTQRIQIDFEKAKTNGNGGKNKKSQKERKKEKKKEKKNERAEEKKQTENGKPSPAAKKRAPMPPQEDHFKVSTKPAQKPASQNPQKPKPQPAGDKPEPQPAGDKLKPQWKPERTKPVPVPTPAPAPAAKDSFPKKAGSGNIDKAALLKEMIELGGTEEDLALIDGISSDDEEEEVVQIKESGKPKDVKMTDIEAFMKEIGLQGNKLPDVEEDEIEEEEEESDEDDFDGDEEDESEEAEDAEEDAEMEDAEPAAAAAATVVDKNSKLVDCTPIAALINGPLTSCSYFLNDQTGTLNRFLLSKPRPNLSRPRKSKRSMSVPRNFSKPRTTSTAKLSLSSPRTGSS
jgi:ribosome biogenesis protein MAK21